jgi:hypothetical protein
MAEVYLMGFASDDAYEALEKGPAGLFHGLVNKGNFASGVSKLGLNGKKVFIVDSNEQFCKIAAEYLKLDGCKVTYFTNPPEALKQYEALAKELRPDAVLFDIGGFPRSGEKFLKSLAGLDMKEFLGGVKNGQQCD